MKQEQPSNGYQGSELHRLKTMQSDYDVKLFNKLHKICKPVIKNLASQIDPKRYNLTRDIIESYFWDKMLFVFNKYYGTCSDEHLKARILSSLSIFKNKLLRAAYSKAADYNQSLRSLEDLFDDSKEDRDIDIVDDSEEVKLKDEAIHNKYKKLFKYMEDKLSPDSYLVFEVLYCPPPIVKKWIEESHNKKITNRMLVEFFGLEVNSRNTRYISDCRDDVNYWIVRVREEL